jgi:hypothetical protein
MEPHQGCGRGKRKKQRNKWNVREDAGLCRNFLSAYTLREPILPQN